MGKHWTPRHLLHGFSPDGECVWVYDKRGQEGPKLIGINGVAQSKNAFSTPVEKLISTIEGAASPAIHAFRGMTGPTTMSHEAKLVVSHYLAMFVWHRDPAVRKRHNDQIKAHAIPIVKARMRDRGVPLDDGRGRISDEDLERWFSNPNSIMSSSWHPNNVMRLWFSWMTWTILESKSEPFILPDTTMIASGLFRNKDTQVFLPLSKNRILMASWRGGPSNVVQVQPFKRNQVHFVNKHGIEKASRFVYTAAKSDGLNRVVKKNRIIHGPVDGLDVSGDNENMKRLEWSIKNYDDLEQMLCFIAPNKHLRHEWSDPVESSISGLPECTITMSMCRWCGCRKMQYENGRIELQNGELDFVCAPVKNWWQRLALKAEDNEIVAMEKP